MFSLKVCHQKSRLGPLKGRISAEDYEEDKVLELLSVIKMVILFFVLITMTASYLQIASA